MSSNHLAFGLHVHAVCPQATPTVEILKWIANTVQQRQAGDVFAQWFDAKGRAWETFTFGAIWEESGRIAHDLRVTWGLSKGDRAILCYGFGLDFFAAFLGCLRAGILAVPVCEYLFMLILRSTPSFFFPVVGAYFDSQLGSYTYLETLLPDVVRREAEAILSASISTMSSWFPPRTDQILWSKPVARCTGKPGESDDTTSVDRRPRPTHRRIRLAISCPRVPGTTHAVPESIRRGKL